MACGGTRLSAALPREGSCLYSGESDVSELYEVYRRCRPTAGTEVAALSYRRNSKVDIAQSADSE